MNALSGGDLTGISATFAGTALATSLVNHVIANMGSKKARCYNMHGLTLSRAHVDAEQSNASTCAQPFVFASLDRVPYAPYQHITKFLQW